ncbi:molecular chaperone GrpE [Nocardioides terrae]|uniref:Protein GrpE n=1 Tax=Nocardioides terrae TaxID=574651 RepID=A0A1I1ERH1_9ACTN|nr:nucleotide exchange factor GrpE [Nocardioides terrae]SFB89691.1 molecular chaperone GrpE [Nocardioides terrae]
MTEEREHQVTEDAAQPSTEPDAGSVDGAEAADSRDDVAEAAENVDTELVDEDPQAQPQRRIDELTGDLQRLQAEYLNYKRRVDRDRELVKENATYSALAPIVDVLDNIDRAREHGPLEGGFKAVADQLERVVSGLGLTKFGEPGEVFDPTLHEALSHLGTDADVTETTVKVIAKSGYRIGERVVRAAQVLVVDPE